MAMTEQQLRERLGIVSVAAVSGLWLMVGGSLYVALANIMLVPFTGRNLIMTAPFSVADLFDGLALILPAFGLALWQARQDAAAGTLS